MTNKTINLTPGETLSLNGNQLHGDTVTLTDNNVGDLLTETVNVSGTVALSDMHINTGSLHFVGGTLNFSGTSGLSGNAFRGVAAVFNSNLTGNGTLDLDGGRSRRQQHSSWPLSCRAGPWHLPSRPIRRCAVPPSWSL